jgi:hypothetical protein
VKWCFGANIDSDWRSQTEEEQRRIYDARGVGGYEEIRPVFPMPEKLGLAAAPDSSFLPNSARYPFRRAAMTGGNRSYR